MKTLAGFFVLVSYILISVGVAAPSATSCGPESCDPTSGPTVRFPFWLIGKQPAECGYRGFDLYCDDGNTMIDFPQSGEFVVTFINYRNQFMYIDDPGSCLRNRSLSFNLSGSPFRGLRMSRFTYFNCSGSLAEYPAASFFVPLTCLSGENDTVVAVSSGSLTAEDVPPTCRRMAEVQSRCSLKYAG